MNNKETVPVRFKDNVFCMLFREKKNLLEMYNALNDTDYTNVDDLAVTTLQGGVYMKYKNDASFVFGQDLYMFEQQASRNLNMPLRFLHYVSDVYREMYPNSELHRRTMLKIPVPHFVTFYNGRDGMKDEEMVLKLSDMFMESKDSARKNKADCGMSDDVSDDSVSVVGTEFEPELELKVRVININPNCGEEADNGTPADSQSRKVPEILKKCHTLRDYMTFVNKVNEKKYSKNKDIRTAVTEAVDECIANGILSDFFTEHRDEVIDVSVYDYDEEGRMRVEREEGREEGHQEELISQIIPKVQKGKDINTIASEVEKDVDNIKPLYDVVVAAAPDYDMDKIMMGISHSSKI
ncbi:MAG: hypothetical protein ACI4D0_00690 [Lachnospira sp.]